MGDGLTLRDICDISYGVLRDRVERQALAAQQRYVIYRASGNWEIKGEEPDVSEALAEFDEALAAEPTNDWADSRDRELFALMGVGQGGR